MDKNAPNEKERLSPRIAYFGYTLLNQIRRYRYLKLTTDAMYDIVRYPVTPIIMKNVCHAALRYCGNE